jgi:hypothetical protein
MRAGEEAATSTLSNTSVMHAGSSADMLVRAGCAGSCPKTICGSFKAQCKVFTAFLCTSHCLYTAPVIGLDAAGVDWTSY